jgi:signal transduction histidine kinase
MDIYLERIIVFFINLVGLWLSIWVLSSNKKERLNQWFVLMTFFVIMWTDFAFLGYGSQDMFLASMFYKLNFAFVILFIVSFYYFYVIYFFKEKGRYILLGRVIAMLGIVIVSLSLYTNLIIKETFIQNWGAEIIFGKANNFYNLFSLSVAFFVVLFSIRKYLKVSRAERLKLQYFSVGILFFIVFNVVFNIMFPILVGTMEYARFGDYSAMILLAFTAYAITKSDLMGVRSLVTQVLIIAISIILILDIVVLSDNFTLSLLKFGVLLTFLYFSKELVKSVKKEKRAKERLEEVNYDLKERNKDLRILFEASSKFNQELDSIKISQNIVDSIPRDLKYLGYKLGFIALYDKEDDRVFIYAVTNSALVRKVEKKFGVSLKTFEQTLSNNNDFIVRTIRSKKEFIGDSLEDFVDGFMDPDNSNSFQKALGAESFISVPLFSSGQAIGAIVFASGKRQEDITIRNKNIIRAFSSHIGSAIENAQLYEKTELQMKEVAKLNNNLRKANKDLKALWKIKSEFLHIASHQLRTPLTAMRGMISMWLAGDFDSLSEEQRKEMLGRIATSTERLNGITNDMLAALEHEGGVSELQFQKVSLLEMIKDIMSTLGPGYVEKGLYLKFGEIDKDIPLIEAEPNYLSQVFSNLIDNACKYTRQGGTEVSIKKSDKFVDIFIKDTGIGIAKRDRNKIFDKFTRGENAMAENASGTGLGLFIVKKILDEQNGKISFESPGEGKGTIFKISLIIKQEKK